MSSKGYEAAVIFSKAAEFGYVKTRLRSVLNDAQCLSLHLALLQDAIEKIKTLKADRFLYLSGSTDLPFSPGIPVFKQEGKDLGERLQNAFQRILDRHERAIIIGTDSPTVPSEILQFALDSLADNEMVLGPAEDGGYYLIGMRLLIAEAFQRIYWGTSSVFQQTMNAVSGKRKVFLLPPFFDIDEPADLKRFEQELLSEKISFLPHSSLWLQDWKRGS